MDIKDFQQEQRNKEYEYVKSAIISNIKNIIKNNPETYVVKYYAHSSFLVRENGKLGNLIWIYRYIEKYFDRLNEDLKEIGINLESYQKYKVKRIGFIYKKEVKKLIDGYYSISW